ncbi:glycosyltransferase family 4 protein [Thioalkalivibrio sp. ALJ3]|uniref:glycosyltransferase family 4 protein n=1 Tax=Thioalkalivibrio sp. ALJ3 TaxID=1240557 RepID=UPI0012DC45DA|nr:glycosyltransferase family 4 protein [Thioalkalivibrio sp. ALJ3]
MKKALVVFYSTSSGAGFKAERVSNYLDKLASAGFSITYIGLPERGTSVRTHEEQTNCTITQSTMARMALALFSFVRLRVIPNTFKRFLVCRLLSRKACNLMSKIDPDVVLTQPYFLGLVRRAKMHEIPVLLECDTDFPKYMWDQLEMAHSDAGLGLRGDRDPWDYYPYVRSAVAAIDLATRVIVFSRHAKRTFLSAGVDDRKIVCHTPPVTPVVEGCPELSTDPLFLWVGNHGVRKGLHVVLDAWKKYKKLGGPGTLRVCGAISPSQRRIRRELNRIDGVEDLGRVDLDKLLEKDIHVLISVSYSEGFPRTVLESMLRGSPVVANSVGGGEILTHWRDGWVSELDGGRLSNCLFGIAENWGDVPGVGRSARSRAIAVTEGYYERVMSEVLAQCS